MKNLKTVLCIFVLVILLPTGFLASTGEKEEKIELSKVPEVVLEAAREAVQGIEIKEAEIEKSDKGIIYELEGTVDGKIYEIEITPEGKVIEVEEENGDDDEPEDEEEDVEEDDKEKDDEDN